MWYTTSEHGKPDRSPLWCLVSRPSLSSHRALCPPLLHHSSQSNTALSSRTSAFLARLTTNRPVGVALPVYRVGADTNTGSQRPIQSLAYEISSSAVIPYTSSAYSHIQSPVFTSCLCKIEGKLGTSKVSFQTFFITRSWVKFFKLGGH